MQKLLSLPQNLVSSFHEITGNSERDWFVTSDPEGCKLGSGGGTAFVLAEHHKGRNLPFDEYLSSEKKIIIHAGGQSRRLPAYAPSGKILTPIPVFRWSQGQKLDQSLLDLQMPLLEKIMQVAGSEQNVMIAAGDVLIQSSEVFYDLPVADVVCFGMWTDPHLASHHGVFFTSRNNPRQLDFMLQKPSHSTIEKLSSTHLFLMDIGIWILSNRAVNILMERSGWDGKAFKDPGPLFYDMYSTFGTCLGSNPSEKDGVISDLSAIIIPLNDGAFHHYGTSPELISSTEKIQNRVQDQRNIWHNRVKPHPSLFVQNSIADVNWQKHHHIWIENSHVPSSWTLTGNHIITGIPGNDWELELQPGLCLDMVPVGDRGYCLRVYHTEDTFKGNAGDPDTMWMGVPLVKWMENRNISLAAAGTTAKADIQSVPLFPVSENPATLEPLIRWMTGQDKEDRSELWLSMHRLSADGLCSQANLKRLFRQRTHYRQQNTIKLMQNFRHSVFYQSDLKHTAAEFAAENIRIPDALPESEPAILRCRNHMFRSEVMRKMGDNHLAEENAAFGALRSSILSTATRDTVPKINIFADQIIWGRSPARLDLAGGWSDTPPYCMQNGGSVLNMAVELNGQPPIQVFIRLSQERKIILRSIDNGVSEVIETFDQLSNFRMVGSPFSIPKAALYLAGFHPDFCGVAYSSLDEQLKEFGGGFEISLLAAIPKGSGLGTSSILAATILGTISDFCSLNWDQPIICHRTLILEQLLSTGGGWQDQYGGIIPGIKLLESEPGIQDRISIRWMPDRLFTHPGHKDSWLLYYTGTTRIAKSILAEIVRGMFLNEGSRLRVLDEIKQHAYHLAAAIQHSDFDVTARMVAHSWKLNNTLDSGTNTPEVQWIIDRIQDYTAGFKLLGAGGGGYMLIAAKDPEAAARIRTALHQDPPNKTARFVDMSLSQTGFQVSRS
jgi:galactokinase/mevalonate kinase-like predicted kinase